MEKILIIEDEKDLAEIVAFSLAKDGYIPVTALDGMTLEKARTSPPNLILLDIMLPGMSGIDILKSSNPTTGPPPSPSSR